MWCLATHVGAGSPRPPVPPSQPGWGCPSCSLIKSRSIRTGLWNGVFKCEDLSLKMIACRPLAPQQGPASGVRTVTQRSPRAERGGTAARWAPLRSGPWLRLRPETRAGELGAGRAGRREGGAGAGASGRGAAAGFCLGDRDAASAEAEGPAPEASSGLVIALMNII